MQKYSDSTLNFTGSNDVKNLATSQSPPPSQFESFSIVGLGQSPQDACVSPVLHVTKIGKKSMYIYTYSLYYRGFSNIGILIIKEVQIVTIKPIEKDMILLIMDILVLFQRPINFGV